MMKKIKAYVCSVGFEEDFKDSSIVIYPTKEAAFKGESCIKNGPYDKEHFCDMLELEITVKRK